jgi:hypothetical protein
MKKAIIATILGIAAAATVSTATAQGRIQLYNYSASPLANLISHGAGSSGAQGTPVTGAQSFTVGMYFLLGDVVAAANASLAGDPTAIPGAGMLVASGLGASTPLGDFNPGQYSAAADWTVTGSGATAQAVTVVVVAYTGADYASAEFRGHSQAFLMTTAVGTDFAAQTGATMQGFTVGPVSVVPEPSTFALAGLGLASLVIFRRRK